MEVRISSANCQKPKTRIAPTRQLIAWMRSKGSGDFEFRLAIAALPSLPTILELCESQRGIGGRKSITIAYPFMITKNQYGFSPWPDSAHSVTWKRSGEYPKKTAAMPKVKYKNMRFLNASVFIQHFQLRLKGCFVIFGGGPPNATQ